MRYMIRKSVINVIGKIWMPSVVTTYTYEPDSIDVRLYLTDEAGNVTRDSVARYLDTHAGDFAEIIDFEASIEHDDQTIDIPWSHEDSEDTFLDATQGE